MNAVSPFPVKAVAPAIGAQERMSREAEINFARGSIRFEGGILAPEVEALNARYVAGEISGAEHMAAILALYHVVG